MTKPSIFLNLSLLKTHAAFRVVFLARLLSLISLGLLAIAVPVQIQAMTHSALQVGLAVTLAGIGMFVGLMFGGVLADRYERRRLILLARSTCGVAFVGLCVNASLTQPSLVAIYALSLWDGFFGAIGVTALLAATPALVGREHMVQAGAINMLTVRLGLILSPLLGGLLIAAGGVAWNYGLAAVGTLITVLLLLRLPALPPPPMRREHPLRALVNGIGFLFENRVVGTVALIGGLLTLASAVRVLYPALAADWQLDATHLGLMYAASPLGAAVGAIISGRLAATPRPGNRMIATAVLGFTAIALFSVVPSFWLALLCLAGFGYLSAVNALLQYALIQAHTPDHLLGRVNGLWTAQNVTGDALGAALLGGLGSWLLPARAALVFGLAAIVVGLVLALTMRQLRQVQFDAEASAVPARG